jgi:hypothetical protein
VFRLDPAAEDEVRQRLGHQEADAFLARLEHLSFDIAEPLEQVYGGVADTTASVTELVLDALEAVPRSCRSPTSATPPSPPTPGSSPGRVCASPVVCARPAVIPSSARTG